MKKKSNISAVRSVLTAKKCDPQINNTRGLMLNNLFVMFFSILAYRLNFVINIQPTISRKKFKSIKILTFHSMFKQHSDRQTYFTLDTF